MLLARGGTILAASRSAAFVRLLPRVLGCALGFRLALALKGFVLLLDGGKALLRLPYGLLDRYARGLFKPIPPTGAAMAHRPNHPPSTTSVCPWT
jgi:hypothetical protein